MNKIILDIVEHTTKYITTYYFETFDVCCLITSKYNFSEYCWTDSVAWEGIMDIVEKSLHTLPMFEKIDHRRWVRK